MVSTIFSWTDIDVNVTCRQLGFNGGFFRFLSYAGNDSLYMLYHRPQCVGDESDILLCPGRNEIKIGSRTCGKHIRDSSHVGLVVITGTTILVIYLLVKSSHCNSFENRAPVDEIYGCPSFSGVAETWLHGRVPGLVTPRQWPLCDIPHLKNTSAKICAETYFYRLTQLTKIFIHPEVTFARRVTHSATLG